MSSSAIKLIVGLGNPGKEYAETRHNTGFWFVDLLAMRNNASFRSESRHHGHICRFTYHGQDCRLLKPSTFMNRSGLAVASLANYFRLSVDEILVAHDELDLPAGSIRLKTGGGHAGHTEALVAALHIEDSGGIGCRGADADIAGIVVVNIITGLVPIR